MGRQIAVCKFCAKRGRMRHDGFCSAKCALDADTKGGGASGFTTQDEIAKMIREGEARRKKGKK